MTLGSPTHLEASGSTLAPMHLCLFSDSRQAEHLRCFGELVIFARASVEVKLGVRGTQITAVTNLKYDTPLTPPLGSPGEELLSM